MSTGNLKQTIEQFVDYLLPDLTPYESALYIYLLRNSIIKNDSNEIRIGKRTIASSFSKGARGEHTSYAHVSEVLSNLQQKGCIFIGDVDRLGTLYSVILPKDVPSVVEKIVRESATTDEDDYFTNPSKRKEIFERDGWICQYCGDTVNDNNSTLDHYLPQSKGGKHDKDNLRTCCFICNSIKSGKSYEEAAPLLLKSIQERRAKSAKK